MSELVLEIQTTTTEGVQGPRAKGTLSFGEKTYSVVTGGYGKGFLPKGSYTVHPKHVVEKNLDLSMKTGTTEFFIPITPDFHTERGTTKPGQEGSLGIHPDGNVLGTEGCIGLPADDAASFWRQWESIWPIGDRPTRLTVR